MSIPGEVFEVSFRCCLSAALDLADCSLAIHASSLAQGRVPSRGHSAGLKNERKDQCDRSQDRSCPEPQKDFEKQTTHGSCLFSLRSNHELIACPAHSLDTFSRGRLPQFLPQIADVHIDHTIERSHNFAA